jgi:hypothetical protein
MKDKELKIYEIESSHTLGGSGEGRVHCPGESDSEGSGEGVDVTRLSDTL